MRQGAHSLEDAQGDFQKVVEQQAAHGLEDEVQDNVKIVVESQAAHCLDDGMHQGAHSLKGVQDDVQKVVEHQAHSLEDVKEPGGGGKEVDSVPA